MNKTIKIAMTIVLFLGTLNTVKAHTYLDSSLPDNEQLFKKKVLVSCSEPDAKIYVDGKMMGTGQLEVIILKKSCITVEIYKTGFLLKKVVFCNKRSAAKPPKTYYVELERDDAFDASIQTDMANIDIEIKSSKSEKTAWKLMSQIVTNSFDIIELTDRETGYLRTAWTLKSFKQNTIRTRVIVKQSSSSPLIYKIKLVSEQSEMPGTSIKRDELFRDWDRILRKYGNLISELQSRLR